MTWEEQQALQDLANNFSLTIKPFNKGGNIVVIDNEHYVCMCKKILDHPDWYRPITPKLIDKFNKQFYNFVDTAFGNGIIMKNIRDYIRIEFPKIPTFDSLPKVHKNWKKLSGRPIISGNGALTENSHLIDEHLRPHLVSLPSYVKDTIHFLQILENL